MFLIKLYQDRFSIKEVITQKRFDKTKFLEHRTVSMFSKYKLSKQFECLCVQKSVSQDCFFCF